MATVDVAPVDMQGLPWLGFSPLPPSSLEHMLIFFTEKSSVGASTSQPKKERWPNFTRVRKQFVSRLFRRRIKNSELNSEINETKPAKGQDKV